MKYVLVAPFVALLVLAASGCSTGESIQTSRDAYHQAEIMEVLAIGQQEEIERARAQVDVIERYLAEARKEKAESEKDLAAATPIVKELARKMKTAGQVELGYLDPEYREKKGRMEMLQARVGQYEQEISALEDQKQQFSANLKAQIDKKHDLEAQARDLRKQGDRLLAEEQERAAAAPAPAPAAPAPAAAEPAAPTP